MIKQINLIGYKISHLFLLLFCLLCISCSKKDISYFPLSEGYKWQYDVTLITRDGLDKQKYLLNNLGETNLNGSLVYLRQSLDGTKLYYSVSDEGISYLGSVENQGINPEINEDKQLVFPASLSVGTVWEQSTTTKLLKKTGPPQKTEFKIIADVPLEVKIEALDESVTVPAGRFDKCMKITMTGSSFKDAGNYVGLTLVDVEQTNWYAPGVGLIKMERKETTQRKALDKGSLLIELEEFEAG
jgi:uncharacterized protein DUF3108